MLTLLSGRCSLLIVLIALLFVPKDAVSLDCDYAIKLYDDAAKECKAGVRHEEVRYQPCEFAKLLEKNYRTCTGEPTEEPQSEFGVVMLLDKLVEDDGVLVAASQEGYEEAKLTALKACLMRGKKDEDRCEEITRFGDTCFAVAEGQGRYAGGNIFTTAEGDSRGQAEIVAIGRCEEQVPQTTAWVLNCEFFSSSKCSSADIICAIKASGCSPYEVVESMEGGKFRAQQTLEQVSKKHEKRNDKLDESKIWKEWLKAERSPGNSAWVKGIQLGLKKHGFSPGPIDGIWGLRTLQALRNWQESIDEPKTDIPPPGQEEYLMDWKYLKN